MKKSLTIILTLILGFAANWFIMLGLMSLSFLAYVYLEGLEYVIIPAGTALFAALLGFLSLKLNKIVNGAVFIICAQLPSVVLWAVLHIAMFSDGSSLEYVYAFFVSLAPMAAALIVSALTYNKDRIGKW